MKKKIFKTKAFLKAYGNGKQGSFHHFRYAIEWLDEYGRHMSICRASLRSLLSELSLPRYKDLAKIEGIKTVGNGRNVSEFEAKQVADLLGTRLETIKKRILRNRKG